MGGTAVKGKPEVLQKFKNSTVKFTNSSKTSTKSSTSFNTPKKFQSTSTVGSYKNSVSKIGGSEKSIINNMSEKDSTRSSMNNPRGLYKKVKAIQKTKTTIDAATEIDVLKIIMKNNYDFEDLDLIDNCLVKHFFMRCLEQEARNEIIKEMSLCKVDADTFIFRQDSIGNFFYIIKEGDCELFINENFIKTLKSGESFGELALMHGAPRSGSVKTKGITFLWCLERRNFRKIIDHINKMNYEENKKFISTIPIFTNIEMDIRSMLASNLIKEFYDKDKVIVKGNITFVNFEIVLSPIISEFILIYLILF